MFDLCAIVFKSKTAKNVKGIPLKQGFAIVMELNYDFDEFGEDNTIVVYKVQDKKVVEASVHTESKIDYMTINEALDHIGVIPEKGKTEFETLALYRFNFDEDLD